MQNTVNTEIEYLFDETEKQVVRHVCLATNERRYDFSLCYSGLFYGKSMVTCLQSGNMLLMSADDFTNEERWVSKLGIAHEDVECIKDFFASALTSFAPAVSQY